MGKTLYIEAESGISGDMTVAALLDLGADKTLLEKCLSTLSVDGFEIKISRVKKAGLDMCDFDVVLDKDIDNHDHDMEWLHGHSHEHEHHHGHEHHHEHEHHHGTHEHRKLSDVCQIIDSADITDGARKIAHRIFGILAEAEAKAHGSTKEEVHFHEVGAVDSIVDILSVAICLDNLDITDVIIPSLSEGRGTIRCQHGILPIPVPAVANIVMANNLVLKRTNVEGELVTPTGAAIAAAVCTSNKLPESYKVKAMGMGAGKRNYDCPGFLRLMLIEAAGEKEEIVKLESNVDDCTGENLGYVMDKLFEAGARDVHYTSVYMKKNRPAYQINVICSRSEAPVLEEILFRETTTIGIRRIPVERNTLERKIEVKNTPWGEVRMKVCSGEKVYRAYPEYEDVARICRKENLPFQEVYRKLCALCD